MGGIFGGSPKAPSGPSPEEIARQQAEARRIAEAEEKAKKDKEREEARGRERERLAGARGYMSTLAGGGAGLLDEAQTAAAGLKQKLGA